jgi:hypothetical protein
VSPVSPVSSVSLGSPAVGTSAAARLDAVFFLAEVFFGFSAGASTATSAAPSAAPSAACSAGAAPTSGALGSGSAVLAAFLVVFLAAVLRAGALVAFLAAFFTGLGASGSGWASGASVLVSLVSFGSLSSTGELLVHVVRVWPSRGAGHGVRRSGGSAAAYAKSLRSAATSSAPSRQWKWSVHQPRSPGRSCH